MSQTSAATAIELSTLSRVLLKIPVPWVFVLGYFVGLGLQHAILPRPYLSTRITHGLSVFGMAIFGAGCVIAGWGLMLFHMARTTTTPGEASKTLVMRGPYRFTRNPMYVGLTLAYLGEMAILVEIAPLIPLLFVIAYVNWIVIPVEETKLRAVFGEGYAQYCDHVGRWI